MISFLRAPTKTRLCAEGTSVAIGYHSRLPGVTGRRHPGVTRACRAVSGSSQRRHATLKVPLARVLRDTW